MADNYVVLRASPDWLHFNLEDSREFCRKIDLPENLIIDFADRWQLEFGVDFRQFRHEMKQIALDNIATCRQCRFLTSFDLATEPVDDDLFVFIDDDDWIAPDLFEALRAIEPPRDGFLWRSIYLGKLPIPGASPDLPVLQKRTQQDVVFTNNYGVTGSALKRIGIEPIFEHYHAQRQLDNAAFQPARILPYLTCVNKHPCSTLSAKYNMPLPEAELRPRMVAYAEGLRAIELDADTIWIAPYLHRVEAIMRRCLA